MEPKFQIQLKIRKPSAEVFRAVVEPQTLSRYFVSEADGPLREGTVVKWSFAEAPGAFDVKVREVEENRRIVFDWPADAGYDTRVEMTFTALDCGSTMVRIAESGWRPDAAGIKASYDNASGWMHMMCSLKAWLEFGVPLREGGVY